MPRKKSLPWLSQTKFNIFKKNYQLNIKNTEIEEFIKSDFSK